MHARPRVATGLLLAAVAALALAFAMPVDRIAAAAGAPPAPADAYEPDDAPDLARPLSADGTVQWRTLAPAGDDDWISIDVTAGVRYTLDTRQAVPWFSCATLLGLYSEEDTSTPLDEDDDTWATYSHLQFEAQSSGRMLVRVREAWGNQGSYGVSLRPFESGSLGGRVAAGEAGLPGASVYLHARRPGLNEWQTLSGTSTAGDGSYRFYDLVPDDYRLRFVDESGTFVEEYYEDAPGLDEAADVAVGPAGAVSGIDATLAAKGRITGRAVDAQGSPLAGIFTASYADEGGTWVLRSFTWTGGDGSYAIEGLAAGSYRVRFLDLSARYLERTYAGAGNLDAGQDVGVHAGQDTSSIDVTMNACGEIQGRVVDASAVPVQGIWARVYAPDGDDWEFRGETMTGADGTYRLGGLDEGVYRTRFSDPMVRYADACYPSGSLLGRGEDILLGLSEVKGSIDATMLETVGIGGTVRDGAGQPMHGAFVSAMARETTGAPWTAVRSGWSGADGTYLVTGLAADTAYVLRFRGATDDYAEAYHDGVYDTVGATSHTLGLPGSVLSGIDATLALGASLEGTLTAERSRPADLWVIAERRDPSSGEWVRERDANPDAGGAYRLAGLRPGEYRVLFEDDSSTYFSEYWDGSRTATGAASLSLAEGEPRTGISAQLSLVDTTPPVSSALGVPEGWARSDVTVRIDASDGPDGSVFGRYVSVGGQPAETVALPVVVSEDGTTRIEFWAEDRMGNVEETKAVDVRVDKTPPLTSCDATDAYEGLATLRFDADDPVSGIAQTRYRLDDGPLRAGVSAVVGALGEHTLEYWSVDRAGNVEETKAIEFTVSRGPYTEVPVAGADRYLTAVRASQRAFADGSADVAVVCTGRNWPDALGAAALAGAHDAPLLLSQQATISPATLAEIGRVGAERVVIVGGTGAVGQPVFQELCDLLGGSGAVTQIGGLNRYETAAMVASEAVRVLAERGETWDGRVFVATGLNFPDALAASPLAVAKARPLLLVNATMPGVTADTITSIGATEALVLGGTGAVSDDVFGDLEDRLGAGNVERLAGRDRYQTALRVASQAASEGLIWNGVALATGRNFPDALAGGVMQGHLGSFVVLTPSTYLHEDVRTELVAHKADIGVVRFLGGLGAVEQAVRDAVALALE